MASMLSGSDIGRAAFQTVMLAVYTDRLMTGIVEQAVPELELRVYDKVRTKFGEILDELTSEGEDAVAIRALLPMPSTYATRRYMDTQTSPLAGEIVKITELRIGRVKKTGRGLSAYNFRVSKDGIGRGIGTYCFSISYRAGEHKVVAECSVACGRVGIASKDVGILSIATSTTIDGWSLPPHQTIFKDGIPTPTFIPNDLADGRTPADLVTMLMEEQAAA